ncbi:MAG TPA: AAA family ATPase, partial [Candidatus Polarisedimenticolia bacterium]|nr:AAA family ATPase [Candidatus Polarisedimenticolia bacterium]
MPARSASELYALREITEALGRSTSLQAGLNSTLETLATQMRMHRGTISILKPGGRDLAIAAA